jgi:hypothetical protein
LLGCHRRRAGSVSQGYRAGKFGDGSVIVFDLLAAQTGGNAVQEGARKIVA